MLVDIHIVVKVFVKFDRANAYKYEENDHNSRCPYKPHGNSLLYYLFL